MSPPFSPEFLALQRSLVGRFSLVRELGRGGMGIVFLARDVSLDRNVAIKLLPPTLAAASGYRARFLREARLAAGLSHPNIVPIHIVDEVDDQVFFVMGYVEGESLGSRIRRGGPMTVAEVRRVTQQVAWALGHAHARGIIHRDVKPDNILLERDSGRALVTDFGIAGFRDTHTPADGAPAGTPLYLSPEQAQGERGDARSDLYALGVTAWYALTGRHPHEGANLPRLLIEKRTQPAAPLRSSRRDIPEALATAIDRCLAMRPEDRWGDAEAFARELHAIGGRWRESPPVVRAFVRTTMPLGSEVASAATAALAALGVMWVLSDGGLFSALAAQALALPVIAISGGYAVIRIAQSATAALDVLLAGHDHQDVVVALEQEERERVLEGDGRTAQQRRRVALWYAGLGTAKTAFAIWLLTIATPAWIQVFAAAGAVLIPMLTVMKTWSVLEPGPGRWPRILRGGLGRRIFSLLRRFVPRKPSRDPGTTPTVTLLGGAIEDLYAALPDDARRQLADVPVLARQLQREIERVPAGEGHEVARERAATVAAALESLRLELLSLQAGLRSVPDVTRYLEEARGVSERVDVALGLPPATPTSR